MPTNDAHIKLRVPTKSKELWEQAAGTKGLSEFIRRTCDQRAREVLNNSRVEVAQKRLDLAARRGPVFERPFFRPDPK